MPGGIGLLSYSGQDALDELWIMHAVQGEDPFAGVLERGPAIVEFGVI